MKNLWIAVYHHRFGTDVFPFFLEPNEELTDEMVISEKIGDEWEGDEREDEWLEHYGPYSCPRFVLG